MALDPTSTIAQNIIDKYKARNPNSYDPGEEAINKAFLEDLLGEIFDVQLKTKAQVKPGAFTAGGDPVSGLGGPLQ